jgi:starvation-inducible outer membrane lipoprotein
MVLARHYLFVTMFLCRFRLWRLNKTVKQNINNVWQYISYYSWCYIIGFYWEDYRDIKLCLIRAFIKLCKLCRISCG